MERKFEKLLNNRRRLRRNSTPQETIFWSRVRAKRFKGLKFRRQHSIGNYIVDFYCPDKKLVIELDGCQHKREKDVRYDTGRTNHFESLGLRVLRFWNNEINDNLEGVFLKIEEVLVLPPLPYSEEGWGEDK